MDIQTAASILEGFNMVESPDPSLVTIINQEHPMAHNTVTLLTYGKHRYMILQDDSGTYQPEYVERQFTDVMYIPSEGYVVLNPEVQLDGEKYALGHEGHEYYLWSYDKDE